LITYIDTSDNIEAMLRIMIFAVIGALGVVSLMGQGQKVVCPGMEIKASAESVTRGDKVTFHAVVTGDFDHSKLQYNWAVEPEGFISDGQGTPTVIIDTRKVFQKDHVTVALVIGPFSPDCVDIISQSVRVLAPATGSGTGNGIGTGRGNGIRVENPARPPASSAQAIRILSKPAARYTEEACNADFSGSVMLRVTFLKTGQIGPISPIKQAPFGLNERAIEAAKHITFEPAIVNGEPVTVTKLVEYTFQPCTGH